MHISLIKNPSLLRDGIFSAIKEGFVEYEVTAFDSQEAVFLLGNIADLIIIDLDTEINIDLFIEVYKSREKKIIVWTSNIIDHLLIHLFKLNLDGYFYNGMDKKELINALKKIILGGSFVHSELSPILLGDYIRIQNTTRPVGILSEREWDILELLVNGLKNDEIAQKLYISDKTVKNHVSSIFEKLSVNDRTNAVIYALKQKWFAL